MNFKLPKTIKELRRFLGMLNFYRRFIPGAASAQSALTSLLKGQKGSGAKIEIQWTEDTKASFKNCKDKLAEAVCLAHPSSSPDARFILRVDASSTGVGGALEQRVGRQCQPIGFFSQKLNSTQMRYSTYDRELLGAFLAVKNFAHLIEGRKLTILTDHRPLTFAFTKKQDTLSQRQARQLSFISEFTCDIQHVAGHDNIVADHLSRLEPITIQGDNVNFEDIAKAQKTDLELRQMLEYNETSLELHLTPVPGQSYKLYCDNMGRPFIPTPYRKQLFEKVHGLSHPSVRKSTKLMTQRFVWPSIRVDCRSWAKECERCQKAKVTRHTKSPHQAFPPSPRLGHVHIDLVGPLPPNRGFRYCLTMIDRTTSWPEAIPVADMTASTVAKAFYEHWVTRYGVPAVLTSDRGTQFTSSLFQKLNKILGIQHYHTSAYHPQANVKVERWHRCLKNAIRCHQTDRWVDILPTVLLGLRSVPVGDGEHSPAELLYGEPLAIPGELLKHSSEDFSVAPFLQRLREQFELIHSTPHRQRARATFISPEFQKCTHVFVRREGMKPSLAPAYEGPYLVINKRDKTFDITRNGKTETVSIDRLKPAYKADVKELRTLRFRGGE